MQIMDKDLKSIQEARILAESARDAHNLLKEYDQSDLDRVVNQLITTLEPEIPELIDMEFAEIRRGNKQDKLTLIEQYLPLLKSDLANQNVIGILNENKEEPIETVGVSLGVVAGLLPMENVILNSIYLCLIAVKSGNAIVLVPHSKSEHVVARFFQSLDAILAKTGLPNGAISFMENTTEQGVLALSRHKDVDIVVNIGCPDYFDGNTAISKPMIYGGVGSTPVFIERTADISQAAAAIVSSRGFDNGLLPAAEQFVISEGVIVKEAKDKMIQAGAHFMTAKEEQQLLECLFLEDGEVHPAFIGQSAVWLAKKAGFDVPADTKVLVSEQNYIFDENPFINELKCPILTFYLEPDWIHACEKCIQLLKEKRNGHTLAIHSRNPQVIREFALKKPVGRMIVNGPASFSSIGLDSTLPLSLILGGSTTGRGYTAKNITAKDLTYQRKIGYHKETAVNNAHVQTENMLTDQALLEKFLRKIMNQ